MKHIACYLLITFISFLTLPSLVVLCSEENKAMCIGFSSEEEESKNRKLNNLSEEEEKLRKITPPFTDFYHPLSTEQINLTAIHYLQPCYFAPHLFLFSPPPEIYC